MPLPLPLIGSLLALGGGAALNIASSMRRRRAEEEGEDAEEAAQDPRTLLVVRTRSARQALQNTLSAYGARKLEVWQHSLGFFAKCLGRLEGASATDPYLMLEVEDTTLPPFGPERLARMLRCGELVQARDDALQPEEEEEPFRSAEPEGYRRVPQWQHSLSLLELLDFAARGHDPVSARMIDGTTDCPTLRWLAADEPEVPPEPIFGGMHISEATIAALRGGEITDTTGLRSLLAVLESAQIIAASLLSSLEALDRASHPQMTALQTTLHINNNYARMSDLAMPTMELGPRRLVQRCYHLAAALMALTEAPVFAVDGRLEPGISRIADIGTIAAERLK